MTEPQDPTAWEPTAGIVLSWVAVLVEAAGIAMMIFSKLHYTGLETFGPLIAGLLGACLTFASAVAGLVIAAIGRKRSKDRHVRAPALTIAIFVHAAVFVLLVLLIAY